MKFIFLLLLTLSITATVWSAQNINLTATNLTSTQGFEIDFNGANSQFGYSVSSAGDFNGDGIDDFLVGAVGQTPSNQNVGAAYVIYGIDGGEPSNMTFQATDIIDPSVGFQIVGAYNVGTYYLGSAVSRAGDFNGDNISDIIVAAIYGFSDGFSQNGVVYVIYGRKGGPSNIDLNYPLNSSQGLQINGAQDSSYFGWCVSSAGDFNGDGVDDIIIGAPEAGGGSGAAYVIYGNKTGFTNSSIDTNTLDPTQGIILNGATGSSYAGYSVGCARDMNGDGISDVIIGAPSESPYNVASAGSVYIIYGNKGGFLDNSLNLATLQASRGFLLSGAEPYMQLGTATTAGDVNGDGYSDCVLGSLGAFGYMGAVYIVYGQPSGLSSMKVTLYSFDATKQTVIYNNTQDEIGSIVVTADLNSDGLSDIVFNQYDSLTTVYVVYGKHGGLPGNISVDDYSFSLPQGFRIDGRASDTSFGYSVGSAGDVNGDGSIDLIVSSMASSFSGQSNSGQTFIFYSDCALPHCSKCNGSRCLQCNIGYHLNVNDFKCYTDSCPSGTYANSVNCINCSANCDICTQFGCTTCKSGYLLYKDDGQCYMTGRCPYGTYETATNCVDIPKNDAKFPLGALIGIPVGTVVILVLAALGSKYILNRKAQLKAIRTNKQKGTSSPVKLEATQRQSPYIVTDVNVADSP